MSTQGKLTLRNYRCFDWEHPAVLEFGDGFTAFVGSNNSGKSAALKAIYELRLILNTLFTTLTPGNNFQGSAVPQGVADFAELANDNDPTRFEFTLEVSLSAPNPNDTVWIVNEITLEYLITKQALFAKSFKALKGDDIKVFNTANIREATSSLGENKIQYNDGKIVDFTNILNFNN
jgi:predicted ATP-dependent endonuclease of OLD family